MIKHFHMLDYREKEPMKNPGSLLHWKWVSKKSINYIKSLFSARHLLMPNFIKHYTLFDMGAWSPPKMLFTTVPKRLRGESWNLVSFNINLCSIKKSYFWFPRLSGVTMATSLSVMLEIFWSYHFIYFFITKFLKFSKVKSELIFEKAPQNTSKYQISAKSVRVFGSYEHLKFRPMHCIG